MATLGRLARYSAIVQAALVMTTPARAEPRPAQGPRIHLEVAECTGVEAAEVQRIAAIELRADTLGAAEGASEMTRIDVQCEGDRASIQVLDPLTRKSLVRAISLRSVALTARARLLALAAAELVAASWVELEANPTPTVPPEIPPASPAARAAARAVVRDRIRTSSMPDGASLARWQVTAIAEARWFPVDATALLGVGVRVGVDPRRAVGIDLDLLIDRSRSTSLLGTVSFDLVSLGATLRLRKDAGPFIFHGGPGLRAGLARFQGSPYSTSSALGREVDGLWAAGVAVLGASYETPQRLTLDLGLEGGYVLLPVRGIVDGGRDVRAEGALIAVNLGAGWIF